MPGPGPGATFPGPTILYFVNPWVTPDLISGAAKGEGRQGNPTIYVYAFLNNTTGKTLRLVSGTIILTTANSSPNQKVYFVGGEYIGSIYPIAPATGVYAPSIATIDPLTPGAAGGRNGTFIAVFVLDIYDQSVFSNTPLPGTIFIGTAAVNNRATDGSYSSMFFFMDGIYVRTCAAWTHLPGT